MAEADLSPAAEKKTHWAVIDDKVILLGDKATGDKATVAGNKVTVIGDKRAGNCDLTNGCGMNEITRVHGVPGLNRFVYLDELRQLVGLCAWWAFKTWGRYNPAYTFSKRIDSFTQHCNTNEIPLTILSLNEDGLPVGMASLRQNDGIRPDLGPWLGSVYVDPQFRHRGIGAGLVKEIEKRAFELGYKTIYLLTYEPSLPHWYSLLGWEEIGKDVCHGNSVTVMKMELCG